MATSQEAKINIQRQLQHLDDPTQIWVGSWRHKSAPAIANREVVPKSRFWLAPLNLAADAFERQAIMSECGSQSYWVGILCERVHVEDDQDQDGITQDILRTIIRHELRDTASDPHQIPAKDQLLLELRLWQKLLHTTHADVEIAEDDPPDLALIHSGCLTW